VFYYNTKLNKSSNKLFDLEVNPPKGGGVFSCKPIQTFSFGLKVGGIYVEVRFL